MISIFTLLAISCGGDATKDTTDSNQDDIISIQVPDGEIVVFAASDVEQATIDHTVLWLRDGAGPLVYRRHLWLGK